MKGYAKVARELGIKLHLGKYGIQFLPKDPSGKSYRLVRVVPLDGWIFDKDKIIEAIANDDAFSITYSEKGEK